MTAFTGQIRGAGQSPINSQAFIPDIWINEIKKARHEQLIMTRACRSAWPEMLERGQLWKLPTTGYMGVNSDVLGTPVVYETHEPGLYQMTITQRKYAAYAWYNLLNMQSKYDTRKPFVDMMSYALAQDINRFILGMRAAVPIEQQIFHTSDGTPTGTPLPLDEAPIIVARERLIRTLTPGDIQMFVAPEHESHLYQINRFVSHDYQNRSPIVDGEFGRLFGMPVIRTTNIIRNDQIIYLDGDKRNVPSAAPGTAGSAYLPDQEDHALAPLPKNNGNPAFPFITVMICVPTWCWFIARQKPSFQTEYSQDLDAWKTVARQIYAAKTYRTEDIILIHTAV